MSGRKLDRVFAIGHLIIVKREFSAHTQPGFIHQHRRGSVIRMVVDWPMSENRIGLLGRQLLMERLVMSAINDRFTVDLTRKSGSRLQNLARCMCLSFAGI